MTQGNTNITIYTSINIIYGTAKEFFNQQSEVNMVMNLKSLIEAMCYAAGHISGTLYIDSNGEDYKLYVVYSCWNIKKECWYREGLVYNKTNIWTSDDEWNNNWENIIARSIKWNPPTF